MEATNLQPVLPEDFDVQLLRRLAREGRLYFDPCEPSPEVISLDRQQEILQYVSEIDDCVSPEYAPYLSQIWMHIVTDDSLNQQLFITKGRNQGQANRYRMMAIVSVLLEMGVYARHNTLLMLHHRLEHTTRKDSIYTSRLNYALQHSEILHLRHYVRQVSAPDAE